MKDLMIDIETLGTSPNTPVISIGAVFFDVETRTTGPSFYKVLDVNEQLERGRKPDGSTIKWWMGQEGAAKKVFHEKAEPAQEVLNLFARWFRDNKGKYVWGNGSNFDITIMENLLEDYGIKTPWAFWNIMDLRTFRRFQGKGAKLVKSGTNHNAIDDALSQADYVLEYLK